MAYATSANVASEFKNITFGASTAVTSTEVDRFITEAESLINARVGEIYTVPLDTSVSPEAFIIMRMISIMFVADRVRQVLQVKDVTLDELKQGVRPISSMKDAAKLLDKIVSREVILSDAVNQTAHQGMASFNEDNSIEHTFEKGIEQW